LRFWTGLERDTRPVALLAAVVKSAVSLRRQ